MAHTIALVRQPSSQLNACQLTHMKRVPIDIAQACSQHAAYTSALAQAGVEVIALEQGDQFPDGVFVEDTAIVLDEVAIVTRPGADPRRDELASIRATLASYRPVVAIEPPFRLDGGDVLRIGQVIYVGVTTRTDRASVDALQQCVSPFGYRVVPVTVHNALHLKTGCTSPAPGVVVLNSQWIDPAVFASFDVIEVDSDEPFGANTLRVNETLFLATGNPKTNQRIADRVGQYQELDISELAKAEAGLTCMSVVF